MKTFLVKLIVLILLTATILSCEKKSDAEPAVDQTDVALSAMNIELNNLKDLSIQLASTTNPQQQSHLDNSFHHHDSLYWHHHHTYNSSHNAHNDHTHQFVHYDPNVNHSHHYHPAYPDHLHDSLIVVPNGHHPNHHTYHPGIHSLHDHHVIDSLHKVHQNHHR